MTLFQHTGGDPRVASAQLADVLAWYGAVGDAAFGNAPDFGARKASLAVALASIERELLPEEYSATYFGGLLHAVGTIGNRAYAKGQELDERTARTYRWDIPAEGGRLCAQIETLPEATEDLVRWQSECWDGTGYPDQLRWHGIPKNAQYLAIADFFLRSGDPEETLGSIGMLSGRAFGPELVRTFVTWFHMNGGEAQMLPGPVDALDAEKTAPASLLDRIADAVDRHNGVPGRWRRIETLALSTAQILKCDSAAQQALALAARFFGTGEVSTRHAEDSQFDPLSRLGIDSRAENAERASRLIAGMPTFQEARGIIAARAEWYDGTGKPQGLRHGKIPAGANILAAAIAYERLDRRERLDTAAGTQFDPLVVRALLASAKARA